MKSLILTAALLTTGTDVAAAKGPIELPLSHCLTPTIMRERPLLARPPLANPLANQMKTGAKTLRDSFGNIPNTVISTNFALKWGSSRYYSATTAQILLDLFEESWLTEVTSMGHPAPWGTDQNLFNVYIGDTGPEVPSALGAGGYFTYDNDWWPMIVISQYAADDIDMFGGQVVAHEFYHAVQDATQRYEYTGDSAWYIEATAEWMAGEVFPQNAYWGSSLIGFAFLPYLPLNFFDYPDTGALQEYHQYGAFIFPRYLSEQVADWQIIRDSWLDTTTEPDPLEVLRVLLANRGFDLNQVFREFAAHNATWDYAEGEFYTQLLDWAGSSMPGENKHIVAELPSSGTSEWMQPPAATLPQRWGYNIVRLTAPDSGRMRVRVSAEFTGSRGSASTMGAMVVRQTLSGREYIPVSMADGAGTVWLDRLDANETIYLVVTAEPPSARVGERFGYWLQMSVLPPAELTRPELRRALAKNPLAMIELHNAQLVGPTIAPTVTAPGTPGDVVLPPTNAGDGTNVPDYGCSAVAASRVGSLILPMLLLALRRRRRIR